MNEEQITARLRELEAGREQSKANLAAHEGAIQELTTWLGRVKENTLTKVEGLS